MVPGWFFTVPDGSYGFSWFQAGFYGSWLVFMISGWFLCFFSRFQVGLLWSQVGFLVIQGSSLVVHGFMSVFIFFQGSRSVFHGASSVFMVFQDSRLISHGSR